LFNRPSGINLQEIQLMKSERDTSKQIDLYEDCPQQRPIIQQFLKFVSDLRTGYTPVKSTKNTIKVIVNSDKSQGDAFVINADSLQSTAGLARSIVFFNWRDYA
jgi:hypothetical protein